MRVLVTLIVLMATSVSAQAFQTWKFSYTGRDMNEIEVPVTKNKMLVKAGSIPCIIEDLAPEGVIQYKAFKCTANGVMISKVSGCAIGKSEMVRKYNYRDEVRPVRIDVNGKSVALLLYCS